MRVLLTGAAGFIGAHLLAALRQRGADVVATDVTAGPGLRALDVTDAFAVRQAMSDIHPDALLHAAAVTPGPNGMDARQVAAVNAHGTYTVFAAASGSVDRAILVSSAAVLGLPASAAPLTEDAPVAPASLYAASKLAAETVATRAVPSAAVVRLAAAYGPGERPSGSRPRTSLVHRLLAASAAAGPDITLDLVHVADAAEAVAALLLGPRPATGLFHLGGGQAVTWGRLLRAVRAAGHPVADGPGLLVTAADARPVLDIGRIAALTGLRPRPIEDGVRTLLAAP